MSENHLPAVPAQNTVQPVALDVSLEKARALHRVWRALNDGDCPKCHNAVAATDVIRPNLKDGVWLKCPNPDCGFYVLGEEITEIERMFAPAMDAATAIFEQWRASRNGQPPFLIGDRVKRTTECRQIDGLSRVFVGSTHRVCYVLYENGEWYIGLEGIRGGSPDWVASNFERI